MENRRPLALEHLVEESDTNSSHASSKEFESLKSELRTLRREVEDLIEEKDRYLRIIGNLRSKLAPLHNALRAVFGEIDLAEIEEAGPIAPSTPPSNADPRWESYKKRFTGVPSEIIDALLIHGEMQITPLAKLIGRHPETTRVAASKLKAAGALQNSGGMWSLKR